MHTPKNTSSIAKETKFDLKSKYLFFLLGVGQIENKHL